MRASQLRGRVLTCIAGASSHAAVFDSVGLKQRTRFLTSTSTPPCQGALAFGARRLDQGLEGRATEAAVAHMRAPLLHLSSTPSTGVRQKPRHPGSRSILRPLTLARVFPSEQYRRANEYRALCASQIGFNTGSTRGTAPSWLQWQGEAGTCNK